MITEGERIGRIPVFRAEGTSGPHHLVLAFRVGRADEPLPLAGITHLVEHLALVPFGSQPFEYGGQVEGSRTLFWARGTDAQLTDFCNRLAQNLRALPVDRLASEAQLLMTEARSRRLSTLGLHVVTRFGASGWGTMGYEEFGLVHPDADRVRAWANDWFTGDNAVLGTTVGPATALALELRSGTRKSRAAVVPLPYALPGWLHQNAPGVSYSFIGPRTPTFGILPEFFQRRALNRLRYQESLSYEVSGGSTALSNDVAQGIVVADGLPENMSKVWTGLLAVADDFMEHGPAQQEIDEEIEALEKATAAPDFALAELDRVLSQELYRTPRETTDDVIRKISGMTPDGYARLFREAFQTGIGITPGNVAILDPRFTAIPVSSKEEAQGRRYELRGQRSASMQSVNYLAVGDQGLTLRSGPGQMVTIAFGQCALALAWDDGSRTLFSNDGFRVHICPADWLDGGAITETIDARLPADVSVPAGPRPNPDPEALTTPEQRAGVAAKPTTGRRRVNRNWWTIVAGLIMLGAAIARIIANQPHH